MVNNGPGIATAVTLLDTLPTGVAFNSINSSQGTCVVQTGGVSCAFGALDGGTSPGGSATATISVSPPAAGTITNRVTVSSPEFDTNISNNSLTQQTIVSKAPVAATADLSVNHSPSPPSRARPGGTFNYTVNVTNAGPQSATNVVLRDALATTMVMQGASPTQGSCLNSVTAGGPGGTVTCNLGTLASGANAAVVFAVSTPAIGDATDTATVSATESDPNKGNNSQSQTNRIH